MHTAPGQLTENPQEISPMMSHFTGLHDRYTTLRDYTARESRFAAAEELLVVSQCFVCDTEQTRDVKNGAVQTGR